MKNVIVKKADLLAALKENKQKHNTIHAAAIEGYWKELEAELKANLKLARSRKEGVMDVYVRVSAPQNHEDDYEKVIHMVECHEEELIELSDQEFDAYYRNNWHWRSDFLGSNTMYASMGPSGPAGVKF